MDIMKIIQKRKSFTVFFLFMSLFCTVLFIPLQFKINKTNPFLQENFKDLKFSVVEDSEDSEDIKLTKSADPLELGKAETITIKFADDSLVKLVLIEFDKTNHSMFSISDKKWRYVDWIPSTIGVFPFIIWFQDNLGKWSYIKDSIQVIDTKPPDFYDLVANTDISEVGEPITISLKIVDPSGIKEVLLEFEYFNYSINYVGNDIWQCNSLIPNKTGEYYYKIYIQDNANNWREIDGSFSILVPDSAQNPFILPPIFFFIISSILVFCSIIGGIELYQKMQSIPKKVQSNLKKVTKYHNQIQSNMLPIFDDRKRLKKNAKIAENVGDYTKAAEIYRTCKKMTSNSIKYNNRSEELNLELYDNLEYEALFIDSIMSITMKCINDLISRHCIENGMKYYCRPILHVDKSRRPDGLILNNAHFLEKRLINPMNGEYLMKELDINPLKMNKIKAYQFIFTNSFSPENLRNIAERFQMEEMMLFITCLEWPLFQYAQRMELPNDTSMQVRKNVRIINYQLFTELMDFNMIYKDKFAKILKLNKTRNLVLLNAMLKNRFMFTFKTCDLISDLKRIKLIQKDLGEYFNTNKN